MKTALVCVTAISATIAAMGAAEAQDAKKRERRQIDASFFERLDSNKDGIVTMDEIPDARKDSAKLIFERLDSDKDGKLTRAEFDAGMARARGRAERTRAPESARSTASPQTPPAEAQRRPDEPSRTNQPPVGAPPGSPPQDGRPGGPPFGPGGPFGGPPDLFRALDTDGDGRLSKEELSRAAEVLMKHDKNGDGILTPDELAEGLRRQPGLPGGPRPPGVPGVPGAADAGRFVDGMISRSDKNGDGKLSRDEVPELLRDRFDEIDRNKDGFIDKEELTAVGDRVRRRMREGGGPPGLQGRPGADGPASRPGGGAAINESNRERIAVFLREHDKDADGRVSAKEFGEQKGDEFKKLDLNGDGFLSPDELARGL
jgi:Ca2+-binding EF-hand superfamily protein